MKTGAWGEWFKKGNTSFRLRRKAGKTILDVKSGGGRKKKANKKRGGKKKKNKRGRARKHGGKKGRRK